MKKITYIVSDIDKALAFEWIALRLQKKFDLSFILIGKEESKLSFFLRNNSIRFYEVGNLNYPTRIRKWVQVLSILRQEKPAIIHTHLWEANLIGLSAAWLLRIEQRIYTRHHALIHYEEFPSGRKWDVLCNLLATHVVAISKNIEEILIHWDKAKVNKIRLIHHGFDFGYFNPVSSERIENLRAKYHLFGGDFPVVGVISRYMQWKGVHYTVSSFQKIREQFPTAKLVLANAHGEYESTIKEMLKSLPVDSFIEIRFEDDLAALYHLFDVFIHVPVDPHVEAFGQTYIEALIARVPSVFTLSGVAPEFIKHKHNAWVVDFKSSDQITQGVIEIITNKKLAEKLKEEGTTSIQQFSLDKFILALENLYLR